jgi:hypothetical protein
MGVEEVRGEYLVGLIGRYARRDARILEIGSREGVNLVTLGRAGFADLRGVEGDAEKVSRFRADPPAVTGRIEVAQGPVEELLCHMEDGEFDLVFTVGFLFDKSGDSSWLFPQMARLTGGYLVSIEDESAGSLKDAFERLGLKEVETSDFSTIEELESVFYMRVFEKTG